jgi:hypothetical protein
MAEGQRILAIYKQKLKNWLRNFDPKVFILVLLPAIRPFAGILYAFLNFTEIGSPSRFVKIGSGIQSSAAYLPVD